MPSIVRRKDLFDCTRWLHVMPFIGFLLFGISLTGDTIKNRIVKVHVLWQANVERHIILLIHILFRDTSYIKRLEVKVEDGIKNCLIGRFGLLGDVLKLAFKMEKQEGDSRLHVRVMNVCCGGKRED